MSANLKDLAKQAKQAGKNLLGKFKKAPKKEISAAQFRRGEAGTVKVSKKAQPRHETVDTTQAREDQKATKRATKRYPADHSAKPTKWVKNAKAKSLRLSRGGNSRKRTRNNPPMKGR